VARTSVCSVGFEPTSGLSFRQGGRRLKPILQAEARATFQVKRIIDLMKLFCLLAALCFSAAGASNPELAEIKNVYILPMTYSLDQFLAIRLTRGGVLQVVIDPKLADAILTDHIGSGLEEKLNSLYPPAKPANKDKDQDKDKDAGSYGGAPMAGGTRSKGAVFLVDRKTRNVVWSDYVRPNSAQPDELNHVADKIAAQLEKDKTGKKVK
jgi:hypothetical protein